MPIYEYKCSNPQCGEINELFCKKIPEIVKATVICIRCNHIATKIITAILIKFKGPGFFVNDKKLDPLRDPKKPKITDHIKRELGMDVD